MVRGESGSGFRFTRLLVFVLGCGRLPVGVSVFDLVGL
jgi:hypothetical protein